ncbi:MAG: disulfide bond formation protein B [Lautropia sp.]|nr:disulfide bond formation protein B [Lautropia sp.]
MRMNSITHRLPSLAIALSAWGSVGVALFTQHVLDMHPCPWCIAQRIFYLAVGALALLAALPPARSDGGRMTSAFFLILAILGSCAALATALYQHFVAAPAGACGITIVDRLLLQSGLSEWMPAVFQPEASCDVADAPLLGIPYSLWSATLAVILIGMAIFALTRLRRYPVSRI